MPPPRAGTAALEVVICAAVLLLLAAGGFAVARAGLGDSWRAVGPVVADPLL